MRFLDPQDPFFRPRWRRWAVTLAPLAWAGVELAMGNALWAAVFAAAGAYAGWVLLRR
ncbi:MAG: hypothetical protein IE927_16810 [Rhodobacterales bacterium]|nr:hypothetical protein [Rhodobacterales bacterium]